MDPILKQSPKYKSSTAACRSIAGGLVALSLACALSGCVNLMVMAGKVFWGDPKQPSGFEMATGVSLEESQKTVLLYCSATNAVTDEFGHLPSDLEAELIRRMKRHDLQVLPADSAIDVIQSSGGAFDPNLLARKTSAADYIVHVEVQHFSYREHASPNLYRGRSGGMVTGYEVRGKGTDRHAVEVFTHEFRTEYPPRSPIPIDQTSQNVFVSRSLDHLADSLGIVFYDVRTSELIAD